MRIVTEACAGETIRAPGAADKNNSNCSGPSGNTSSTNVINTSRQFSSAPRMISLVSGLKSSTMNVEIYDRFWVKYYFITY